MTTITVFRRPDGTLSGFDSRGHTGYADAGEDIVCAAISALTQATVNGLANVLAAPVTCEIDERRAHLSASLADVPEDKRAGAQLLLQTLVEALKSVEAEYPRFVRVIFEERR